MGLSSAQAAMVGRISEVLTGPYTSPAISLPAYVEFYETGATAAFDLVVLDAQPDRLWRVRSVTTITPVVGVNTYVVHTGTWNANLLGAAEVVSASSLGLGLSSGGSRTLALYNKTKGFVVNTRPSNTALFDGLIETATYSLNGTSVQSMQGESVLAVNFGQAMRRSVVNGDYTNDWITGPILDQNLHLNASAALNPGFVNEELVADPSPPAHMPEPNALMIMCAAMGGGSVLRMRRKFQRV